MDQYFIENEPAADRSQKISRGYRLRHSTHNLIKILKEVTSSDADKVITESCLLFYKSIIEKNDKNK